MVSRCVKQMTNAPQRLVEPVLWVLEPCVRTNQLWAVCGVRVQLFEYRCKLLDSLSLLLWDQAAVMSVWLSIWTNSLVVDLLEQASNRLSLKISSSHATGCGPTTLVSSFTPYLRDRKNSTVGAVTSAYLVAELECPHCKLCRLHVLDPRCNIRSVPDEGTAFCCRSSCARRYLVERGTEDHLCVSLDSHAVERCEVAGVQTIVSWRKWWAAI